MKKIKVIYVAVINTLQWKHVVDTLINKQGKTFVPSRSYNAFDCYLNPAINVSGSSGWYGDWANMDANEVLIDFDTFCELYGSPKPVTAVINDLTFKADSRGVVSIADSIDEVIFEKAYIKEVIDYLTVVNDL